MKIFYFRKIKVNDTIKSVMYFSIGELCDRYGEPGIDWKFV